MAIIKVTKDGVSNNIVGTLEFAKEAFPDSTCEVVPDSSSAEETKAQLEIEGRGWRDAELERTDTLSLLTDHPKKTEIAAYRTKLRDWPSTSDFPDTKPTL
tara:strand:+ start:364 stop:666 length:303 start_codon:yes stop_codon:yes gene_type:complete